MKNHLIILIIMALMPGACGPSQRITNSWINPEAVSRGPYKKIFVMVLSPDAATNFSVEDRLAATIAGRGQEFVLSSAVFPHQVCISDNFTREQMAEAISRTGCDCVLVLTQLDEKRVETYHPGTAYSPVYPNVYGSYYGYYRHYYPLVYTPGYYSVDRTYYIETNFFDLETDQHLWLIQSEAYNPASLDSWFDTYIQLLLDELEKEALLAHE